MGRIRTLIIDDEPLAERRMRSMLRTVDDIEIVGSARDGRQGLDLIHSLQPDLLLLDIKMPGLNGLELLEDLGDVKPVVILVTAFAEFAPDAFDLAATDYLLKPVAAERLLEAIGRARAVLAARNSAEVIEELQQVLSQLREDERRSGATTGARQVWIVHRGERRSVPVDAIDWVKSERDYLRIHAGSASYLLRHPLDSFQKRLDPSVFMRVHRSALVRISRITRVRREGPRLSIVLSGGDVVPVSRRYAVAVNSIARGAGTGFA